MTEVFKRRLTLGANPLGDGRTRFRVWAPARTSVDVVLEGRSGIRPVPLERGADGYFEGTAPAEVGARYRYRLDGGEAFADPCSRFQPEGPHGPSQIVDPSAYRWSDRDWKGITFEGQVLYELHVGSFTPEGTYAGVAAKLPQLKALGVTCVELMPVNTFAGRFNWGYDGVGLYAPAAPYGTPDDLRRLVDEAHRLELGIILDVVYNHIGPDGNYLSQFSKRYFTDRYKNDWGESLNFDGEDSGPVREFFVQNAAYWISEFHFDGLRLDATQNLSDASKDHIVAELTRASRAAAPGRSIILTAENEAQDERYVKPAAEGGYGLDGVWVDDFHHTARVAATGRAEAYLSDYHGTADELLACVLHNSLYQGQWSRWQKQPRGGALREVPPSRSVLFLQNHDQVANGLSGERLTQLSSEAHVRALTALFLLAPQTPLLFMGQEWFASTPFLFFTDFPEGLQKLVRDGREKFLGQFPSAKHAVENEGYHPPHGAQALERSRLDWGERERRPGAVRLHEELLRLRRTDPLFSGAGRADLDGSVLSPAALALRYVGHEGAGDRLLLFNLGEDLTLDPCPHPLLAPVRGKPWQPLWSSEEVRYGGHGALTPDFRGSFQLGGRCALVLTSQEAPR